MNVTYAIVKDYVIKRHSNVITIWSTSLLKYLRSEMQDVHEKESIMVVRGN